MITWDGRHFVTIAIDRRPDGSIRVLLPGYAQGIRVRSDSSEDGGHSRLHVGLSSVLDNYGTEESDESD